MPIQAVCFDQIPWSGSRAEASTVHSRRQDDNPVSENRLMEVYAEGGHSAPQRVDLEHPFTNFFTATTRGGTLPSHIIDVYGAAAGAEANTLRYARIRLVAE